MKLKEKILRIKQKNFNFYTQNDNSWFYSIFNSIPISTTDYLTFYKWWSYAAIKKISEWITGLKYHTIDNNWKIKKSKDIDLISDVLLDNIVSYLKLTWTSYIKKSRIWKTVKSLQCLRSDSITLHYKDDNKTILYYEYNYKWNLEKINPEDIIIISDFNPYNPSNYNYRGVWTLNAVSDQLQIEDSTLSWNRDFFDNDWTPWLTFSSEKEIDESIRKRYINAWKQQFTWKWNKHKIAFLDKGIKLDNYSPIQKDIDFVEQRKFTRDEILWVFWVPKALLWLADWVNVWNVKAFEELFFKNTIFPLARKIENAFKKDIDIFKDFSFNFVTDFLIDTALITDDYNSWIITLNEARAMKWLDPLSNWDVLISKISP